LFRLEKSPQQQIVFLEAEMNGRSGAAAGRWAIEELCDRGSVGSLPRVTEIIKGLYSGVGGDEIIAYCRARMEIVGRNPDRAQALGSGLRIDAPFEDRQVMDWAIFQLFGMRSPVADAILDRYAEEVERRFPDIPSSTVEVQVTMHRARAQMIRPGS